MSAQTTGERTRQGPGRAQRLVRGVVAMVIFLIPVLLLAFAARQKYDPLIDFDNRVIRAATDWTRSHHAAPALITLQEWTQPWKVYIVAGLVTLWAWRAKGLRARALWAAITMLVAWNLGLLAKLIVRRARPIVKDPISHAPGYSFPSGHAFNMAVAVTVLVFLLWPLMSVLVRRLVVGAGTVLALAVGLDRIFLGVHFPSDVLAGLLLGVGITFSSWLGFIGKTAATSSPGPSHPA